jgi:hypothetical protein
MTSTSPLKEKILWWLAMAMPASLAYYVAVRVVTYASVSKYRNTVMGDIGAADAVGWWFDSKVKRPPSDTSVDAKAAAAS